MTSKKLFLLLIICLQIDFCIAQISREERGDSFKWIYVVDKNTGMKGAESIDGKVIVPIGEYNMIVYHSSSGGFFGLYLDKIAAAYSIDGKEIIPFSRGYNNIVKHEKYFGVEKNGFKGACNLDGREIISPNRGYDNVVKHEKYFGVEKNGLEGACDDDGYEIISPQYSSLFYSSVDGFNTKDGKTYIPLGIIQKSDGTFTGVDYSKMEEQPLIANSSSSSVSSTNLIREEKGDSFKWVLVSNKSTGEKSAESPDGKVIVPMGKYNMIVYHSQNGGYFGLHSDKLEAAYSIDGNEIIPFSRGYNNIVKHEKYFGVEKNGFKGACNLDGREIISPNRGYDKVVKHEKYFGVEKNGLKGACDDDGYEIITPQYSYLFYSSIDGFNTKDGETYIPLGIIQNSDGTFTGIDYSNNKTQELATAPLENQLSSTVSIYKEDSPIIYNNSGSPDKEQYRRSSLCLILLTHRDKKYAAEMERVFRDFPLPARYNEHNIRDIRVISVRGKQSKGDIDKLLHSNNVAQKVVGRWFNRNAYTGQMNMDLIHERGGYGASYADYQRSQNNVRGTDMLRDEGIELLQSTFVLVCDMDYIDKKKGAGWAAFGTGLLSIASAAMGAVNQQQAYNYALQGNYYEARKRQNAANAWNAGSTLGMAATSIIADIGGFRVKMKAYLYKLRWDDSMTQKMYHYYWCDNQTTYTERQDRKTKFENESYAFTLDYIGKYKTTSSKTILRSWKNEDEVILDVCDRCVKKGMKELAKTFPVFKPRTPFYFEGNTIYSHIGRKEEVAYGKKYEIVQPYKDKNGQICYKRVGKAEAGSPWDNMNIRFDQYFDIREKGTMFYCKKSSVDLHMPGLQLREL